MGYRMIADIAGLPVTSDGRPRARRRTTAGAAISRTSRRTSSRRDFADRLPDRMRGRGVPRAVRRDHGYGDARRSRTRWYPVRQATSHPVYENDRVTRFAELLSTGLDQRGRRRSSDGRAHARSRTRATRACGLGSDGTDRLVDLVTEAGPAQRVVRREDHRRRQRRDGRDPRHRRRRVVRCITLRASTSERRESGAGVRRVGAGGGGVGRAVIPSVDIP